MSVSLQFTRPSPAGGEEELGKPKAAKRSRRGESSVKYSHEAFARHMAENPHDTAAPLVYADWLADHGMPTAERIVRNHIDRLTSASEVDGRVVPGPDLVPARFGHGPVRPHVDVTDDLDGYQVALRIPHDDRHVTQFTTKVHDNEVDHITDKLREEGFYVPLFQKPHRRSQWDDWADNLEHRERDRLPPGSHFRPDDSTHETITREKMSRDTEEDDDPLVAMYARKSKPVEPAHPYDDIITHAGHVLANHGDLAALGSFSDRLQDHPEFGDHPWTHLLARYVQGDPGWLEGDVDDLIGSTRHSATTEGNGKDLYMSGAKALYYNGRLVERADERAIPVASYKSEDSGKKWTKIGLQARPIGGRVARISSKPIESKQVARELFDAGGIGNLVHAVIGSHYFNKDNPKNEMPKLYSRGSEILLYARKSGEITKADVAGKKVHDQIAGTRLAYHLNQIKNDYAGRDDSTASRIKDLSDAALRGATGGDPYKELGSLLKQDGHKLAGAYNWHRVTEGLNVDQAVQKYLDRVTAKEKAKGTKGIYQTVQKMFDWHGGSNLGHDDYDRFWSGLRKHVKESLGGVVDRRYWNDDRLNKSLMRHAYKEQDRADLAGETPKSESVAPKPKTSGWKEYFGFAPAKANGVESAERFRRSWEAEAEFHRGEIES